MTDKVLEIDVGIKDLVNCCNGKVYENINKTVTVKKTEKKLRRLQCKISRKYEKNKKGKEYAKTGNIIKLQKQVVLKLTEIIM